MVRCQDGYTVSTDKMPNFQILLSTVRATLKLCPNQTHTVRFLRQVICLFTSDMTRLRDMTKSIKYHSQSEVSL